MRKIATYLTLLTGFACTSAMAAEKGTIAILVNSLDNPYYSAEAKGAEAKAKSLGYQTLVLSHGEDVKRQGELISLVIGRKVQGIILDNADSQASVAAVQQAKTPVFRWC